MVSEQRRVVRLTVHKEDPARLTPDAYNRAEVARLLDAADPAKLQDAAATWHAAASTLAGMHDDLRSKAEAMAVDWDGAAAAACQLALRRIAGTARQLARYAASVHDALSTAAQAQQRAKDQLASFRAHPTVLGGMEIGGHGDQLLEHLSDPVLAHHVDQAARQWLQGIYDGYRRAMAILPDQVAFDLPRLVVSDSLTSSGSADQQGMPARHAGGEQSVQPWSHETGQPPAGAHYASSHQRDGAGPAPGFGQQPSPDQPAAVGQSGAAAHHAAAAHPSGHSHEHASPGPYVVSHHPGEFGEHPGPGQRTGLGHQPVSDQSHGDGSRPGPAHSGPDSATGNPSHQLPGGAEGGSGSPVAGEPAGGMGIPTAGAEYGGYVQDIGTALAGGVATAVPLDPNQPVGTGWQGAGAGGPDSAYATAAEAQQGGASAHADVPAGGSLEAQGQVDPAAVAGTVAAAVAAEHHYGGLPAGGGPAPGDVPPPAQPAAHPAGRSPADAPYIAATVAGAVSDASHQHGPAVSPVPGDAPVAPDQPRMHDGAAGQPQPASQQPADHRQPTATPQLPDARAPVGVADDSLPDLHP
jgi:WXG100 family type VII secretion target